MRTVARRIPAPVERSSCGAATWTERRHFCRRGPELHGLADKKVGAPLWTQLRKSAAPPSHGFQGNSPIFHPPFFCQRVGSDRMHFGLRTSDFGLRTFSPPLVHTKTKTDARPWPSVRPKPPTAPYCNASKTLPTIASLGLSVLPPFCHLAGQASSGCFIR